MNKVITINLNGTAYQLEESGYEALRDYLANAAGRLEGNPDKDEIIADIEQAIADKFRALLGAYKTVVLTREVRDVITEMGPVQDASATGERAPDPAGARADVPPGGATASQTGGPETSGRRLYKIREGAKVAGVCNGLAAYFDVDVTLVRVAFAFLAFMWGSGLLLYVLMAFILPEAHTPAEKAAAFGGPSTAEEFIRRAKAGYYEGMKTFHDKQAHREWKRRFKQEMRGWKHGFRREMRANAQHWRQNWHGQWAQHPPAAFGPGVIAPVLSLLLGALLIGTVYVVYLLVTAQPMFGLTLPAGVPLWAGVLGVIVLYQLVAWPLKAMRYSCYYPGPYGGHGLWGMFGSLVGLFFLAFGIWSLDRHVPEFHEWLVQLPGLLHRGLDAVQGWFAKRS